MCQKNDYTRRAVTVLLALITALLVFGATISSAQVASNPPYTLEQTVIAGGGGTSGGAGSQFSITGTIGQAITETSAAAPFTVRSGFFTAAPVAPTAGQISVGGRVLTVSGSGLTNALVTLTDAGGMSRTILTKKSGTFRFDDVNAGATYVVAVNSKRYTFQPQILSILENTTELIFTAQAAASVKPAP